MKKILLLIALLASFSGARSEDTLKWEMLTPSGDEATGRHECSFVEHNDLFYLVGGRGVLPVDIYNPHTNSWKRGAMSPIEINHFQAVVYEDEIYAICAMNGRFPREKPLTNIWIYNPQRDEWRKGDAIPEEHQRGGAGVAIYDGKIYIACGIEYGHTSGTTNQFCCYDPKSGEWSTLPTAPHIRDHFAAIIHGTKLYCIGGRNTSVHYEDKLGAFFGATEPAVDVYDFVKGKWYTMRNTLPVATAAAGVVLAGDSIIYMGGESSQKLAHSQTQSLDINSGTWSQLPEMVKGMHGTGAILYDDAIYWAAGSYKRGGSNLNVMQRLSGTF